MTHSELDDKGQVEMIFETVKDHLLDDLRKRSRNVDATVEERDSFASGWQTLKHECERFNESKKYILCLQGEEEAECEQVNEWKGYTLGWPGDREEAD